MLGKRSQIKLEFLDGSARKALRSSADRSGCRFPDSLYCGDEVLEDIIIQRD